MVNHRLLQQNKLLFICYFLFLFFACSSDAEMETIPLIDTGEIMCNQDFGNPNQSPYILPFLVGKEYLLSQSYCPANPNWGHHNWFAYDFDMPNRDTIIASWSGTVLAVKEDNPNIGGDCSGGKENFVFIQHGDGTVMSYVHLITDGALVEKGDFVRQGQPIGLSGNSGCSAGPHLHVALFKDRTNYDRQSTIPLNYKNAQGPTDSNNGLVFNKQYKAMNF